MRLFFVLFIALNVAAISPHALMAKTDIPVDPRLNSYIENLPEEQRDVYWSMVTDRPEGEREIWIRLLMWNNFLKSESFSTELDVFLSAMAETVDGCLLPKHFCDDAKNVVSDPAKYGSVLNSMRLLSGALEELNFNSDCQIDRTGFVYGFSQKTGEGNIVLMTTTNEDSATCFVRDLGAS